MDLPAVGVRDFVDAHRTECVDAVDALDNRRFRRSRCIWVVRGNREYTRLAGHPEDAILLEHHKRPAQGNDAKDGLCTRPDVEVASQRNVLRLSLLGDVEPVCRSVVVRRNRGRYWNCWVKAVVEQRATGGDVERGSAKAHL